MNSLVRALVALTVELTIGVAGCWAGPCDTDQLPSAIKDLLAAKFAGWRVVEPDSLTGTDGRTWIDSYPGECPGLAQGHFTGEEIGYALNLMRRKGNTIVQQIVYFKPKGAGYDALVVIPPAKVVIVWIMNKFAPGKYRDAERTRTITTRFDTIGVSQVEAWTLVFYWNGTGFRSIATSE